MNRTQAGIRSRPRRPGAEIPPRASAWPLHEGSSEAQSAKTGSDPTAAHELSAARLRKEWVFQFPQQADTTRPHALSISFSFNTPTYPQRTAPGVTACAPARRPAPAAFPHRLRRPPQSLSLGSFGKKMKLRTISFAVLAAASLCGICACTDAKEAAKLASSASADLNAAQFSDALRKLERASELQPDVAEYHVGAGMAALKLDMSDLAERHLRSAERILATEATKDPDRVGDYAMVLAFLGRRGDANKAIRSGSERFPDADNLVKLGTDSDKILNFWTKEWGTVTKPNKAVQ